MTLTDGLQVRQRPRLAAVVWMLVGLVGVVALMWFSRSPTELPVSEETVSVSTPVGQPVYVGVFAPPGDFGRTLHLSGVKVHTTANTEVTVVPLLCRGGTIGVTTQPETFCSELLDPEGQRFGAGDEIVLKITSADPAIAVIERVRLGYREGIQSATQEAGAETIVRVLGR